MFDDMFTFIDPIVELNEEGTSFVIQAETFFEFLEKAGLDRVASLPGQAKIEVPLDIVMSLLRPDELEKPAKVYYRLSRQAWAAVKPRPTPVILYGADERRNSRGQ